MESILEEECYETVCPGIRPENVEHTELGTTEPDPGEELELEVCSAIQLTLDVVLENQFGQLAVMETLK